MQKEAKARIKINNLLQNSGWRFFDDEKGKSNIVLENNAKLTKQSIDEYGNDFEKTKKGFIDFLLLDEKGFPFLSERALQRSFPRDRLKPSPWSFAGTP
ncbi:MAG: type iii restriction protein res subunit, type restriction enzyme, subunit [Candidatus Levybacteria bacterium]|nr:type iii restriction protein res subunit, type restriction enzyme, subunit [Candidatus Levybacteria bacterium]